MSKKDKLEKQDIILEAVKEFAMPKKIEFQKDGKKQIMYYEESKKDITEYEKHLKKQKLKRLRFLNYLEPIDRQHSIPDKIKRLSKKLRVIVSIYHSNGTSTDFVTSTDKRIFTIKNSIYIRVQSSGIFDNKHKMMKFCYYENNPFPIQFINDFKTLDAEGKTRPDGLLLKKTLKFEYAGQLADSKLGKSINLTLIFSILGCLIGVACFITLLVIANKVGVV